MLFKKLKTMKQIIITITTLVFFSCSSDIIKVEDQQFSYDFVEVVPNEPDNEEVILLAKLLQSEAYQGEMADSIATVVLNRKYSEKYPKSIKEVIYQKTLAKKCKCWQPQFDGIQTQNFKREPRSEFVKTAYYWLKKEANSEYYPSGVFWYYTTSATDKDFVRSMNKYYKYTIQNTKFCGI
jgi:spore germination cell wall hydrolase CwlJ-like protein